MKLAIHNSPSGFHPRWIAYCEEEQIPFKKVNCYDNDLTDQLRNCDALLWHHGQSNPRDILIAKQILFALEHTGIPVFPNFNTAWHFDDKVAQKYLLERIDAPLVPSYVFFEKKKAKKWIETTRFPKVFKLRGGAGSHNVKLARTRQEARSLVQRAFGKGFPNYDPNNRLKESWRKFSVSVSGFVDMAKALARYVYPPQYLKIMGKEMGYAYFQEFIPNNDSDTRIIVIDGKAFGLLRYVREGDFRASGSGSFAYEREHFDERCVSIAFDITEKLDMQCVAFDFVFDAAKQPLIVEISYGFSAAGYDPCPGYWTPDLDWHEGSFNPQGWMVDLVVKQTRGR
jgi:glutathione synthase/RimK-type ligase-like ATP-grasp enzyme